MAHHLIVADVGGPHRHVGDEAMLLAWQDALARLVPEATATVVGRRGPTAAPSTLLDGVDGVVISGGGNLTSSWPDLLRQRADLIRGAAERGIPVVTGGQTIGPVLTPGDRDLLGRALPLVDLLRVREERSLELARALDVAEARLHLQVDDTFGWPGRRGAVAIEGPFVAVTLDDSFLDPTGMAALPSLGAQLATIARQIGGPVVLVPHVAARDDLDGSGDARVGRALAPLVEAAGAEVVTLPVLGAAEVAWLTRTASAVVSSRYHPVVFATSVGRPCVAIHRDDYTAVKLVGALSHVGMQRGALDLADAVSGGVVRAFDAATVELGGRAPEHEARRSALLAADEARWQRLVDVLVSGAAPASRPVVALAGEGAASAPAPCLSDDDWYRYDREGYLRLGAVLDEEQLEVLRQRADDLATGLVRNEAVVSQPDTGGDYEALPGVAEGALGTLRYRKLQGLEHDDRFDALIRHPRFGELAARHYGPHAPVALFRAMVMNKPAGQGTHLPWHQDGGDTWGLDRDPLMTIWVALDDATIANGCMEVVEGSHRLGLVSSFGSTLSDDDVVLHCDPTRIRPLELRAGEALLLHNWLVHRSGVNPTDRPRRAFSACYVHARTLNESTGRRFPTVFGAAPPPLPYVAHLESENEELRRRFAAVEAYALDLAAALGRAREPGPETPTA